MSEIDQRAVEGQARLNPPDADVAQRYLDHLGEVVARRDRAIDRRGQAWLQIVNAVALGAYLLAFAVVTRTSAGVESQMLVFMFIIWAQIMTGISQRLGIQRKLSRSQWPWLVAGGILVAAAFVTIIASALVPGFPLVAVLTPIALVTIAFGGYGFVLLRRASTDPRPPRVPRARLDRGVRSGTIVIGAAVGAMTMLMAAPADLLRSGLLMMLLLLLLAWMFAMNTSLGLPAIGEAWRWPHLLAFVLAAGVLVSVVLPGSPLTASPLVLALLAAGVVALFVAVAFVPGYARRG